MRLSRAGLALLAVFVAAWRARGGVGAFGDQLAVHVVLGSLFASLTALSLPTMRRHDLTLGLMVTAAVLEFGSASVAARVFVHPLAADIVGLLLMYAPAAQDGLRKRMREEPQKPAFDSPFKAGPRQMAPAQPDRRRPDGSGMLAKLLATPVAWLMVCGLMFATLCPQTLRPHLGDAQVERFAAYFLATGAFVVAYPRRPLFIAGLMVLGGASLELAQLLAPGRDPGVADAIEKGCGALVGAASAWIGLECLRQLRRRLGLGARRGGLVGV